MRVVARFAWVVALVFGWIGSCAAEASDWGGVYVGKDANGHIEASLHNGRLNVRYGWAPPEAEGWITNFVCDGSPNMAGEMLDASAGRGTLAEATIIHDGEDFKTIDLKWKTAKAREPSYEQTITIYPDLPILRIDYITWNVNIVDIGGPGGEKRDRPDRVTYTIYGSEKWKRGFVTYPMVYMDRAFWDTGFNGILKTDDSSPLDYHGSLIMGITANANGMGYGRVIPTQTIDVLKLLVHAGFELFPCFKREHQRFTSYLYAVKGGPEEVMAVGKKLADGGYPAIVPVAAAPLASPPGGVFMDHVMVSLASAMPEEQVRFTTDGSEPTEASPVYSGPISITSTTLICAKAWRAGWGGGVTTKENYIVAHKGKLDWWRDAWSYRIGVEVGAGGAARKDAVAGMHFDFDAIQMQMAGKGAKFSWPSLRVCEIDAGGNVIDENVVYQWDSDGEYYSSNKGTIYILLKGVTAADAVRRYEVYFDTMEKNIPGIEHAAMMEVREDVPWKSQLSYQVITDRATYYLHETGGALAGMIDADGNDWIGYQPGDGSAGEDRGIPNCGEAFHPGYPIQNKPGTIGCESVFNTFGAIHARISCDTADHGWAGYWDFFPDYARFTITKAPKAYSFLYEGTPAGGLDLEKDFYITSDGVRHSVTDLLREHLASPRWVFFRKEGMNRGLFLGHGEEPAGDISDEFWKTENNTAVWGFGCRDGKGLLSQFPGHLTVGFLENSEASKLPDAVGSVFRDLDVKVGVAQQRP